MKVFCVYTPRWKESKKKFNRCVSSSKLEITPFESVYFKDIFTESQKLNLSLRYSPVYYNRTDFENKTAPATRIANGITHFKIYLRCLELNEPVCILEHDSVFVNDNIPTQFPEKCVIQISSHFNGQLTEDILHLCGRSVKMRKYGKEEPEKIWKKTSYENLIRHPLKSTNGTSGYIITPAAAYKMVNYIKESGVGFADRVREEHIGSNTIFLQVPQSVICLKDIDSTKLMK